MASCSSGQLLEHIGAASGALPMAAMLAVIGQHGEALSVSVLSHFSLTSFRIASS